MIIKIRSLFWKTGISRLMRNPFYLKRNKRKKEKKKKREGEGKKKKLKRNDKNR